MKLTYFFSFLLSLVALSCIDGRAATQRPPCADYPRPGCVTATATPGLVEEIIYSEGLSASWTDWSWGSTVGFDARSPVFSGARSMSWRVTSAYGGLYLHHRTTGVTTTNLLYLRFAIRVIDPLQEIGIILYDSDNKPLNRAVRLNDIDRLQANQWKIYSVSLEALKGTTTIVKGVVFQELSGKTYTSAIYVDEVRLSNAEYGKTPTPSPTPTGTATATPTPTPTPTPPPSTQVAIYRDALGSDWADWSWSSTRDFSNSTPAAAVGSYNVSFATTADFAGLYFRYNAGLQTTNFTHIKFYARRESGNTTNYTVFFKDINSNDLTKLSLSSYGGQPSTSSWTLYSIPLTDFGAANTTIAGFIFQVGSPGASKTAYVDEVLLTKDSSQGSNYFSTLPPGSAIPLPKATCLALVRSMTENRYGIKPPSTTYDAEWDNRTENAFIPVAGVDYEHTQPGHVWDRTRGVDNRAQDYLSVVDGNPGATLTTDELIQFYSCRWGFDEDLSRAKAAKESSWQQKQHGDIGHGESFGIMQVKSFDYTNGSYPASKTSTAYNIDRALAWQRVCFEGWVGSWIVDPNNTDPTKPYVPGDIIGCLGFWWSGRWYDSGALNYLYGGEWGLMDFHSKRHWETPNFPPARPD